MSYKITQTDLTNSGLGQAEQIYLQDAINNGQTTVKDILSATYRIPKTVLHWMKDSLPMSKKELEKYSELCEVTDSQFITDSTDVTNSYMVNNSKNVMGSSYVFSSNEISKSKAIYQSRDIKNSSDVANSFMVYDSSKVEDSRNISDSTRIMYSTFIRNSTSILSSSDINHSSSILGSKAMKDCHFCCNCRGLSSAFFCMDLTPNNAPQTEYLLFNEPITESTYVTINKQFHDFLEQKNVWVEFCDDWVDLKEIPISIPEHQKTSPTKILTEIPDSFWEWVQTLPGYSADYLTALCFAFKVI